MHNYNNFHEQMESFAGPREIAHRIPNGNQNNVAGKDFWRLTPSKWPRSQNTGIRIDFNNLLNLLLKIEYVEYK
jgi:hypothetical protein